MMNKDEILAKSRKEHEGREDERELQIATNADQIGMLCGGALAAIIACVSRFMDTPLAAFSALTIYLTMLGSSRLYQFIHTKKKSKLFQAVVGLAGGLVYLILLIKVGLWS